MPVGEKREKGRENLFVLVVGSRAWPGAVGARCLLAATARHRQRTAGNVVVLVVFHQEAHGMW